MPPHRQRVNVLDGLQKGVRLMWEAMTHTADWNDVIAFFDRLGDQVVQKTVVMLDNAPIPSRRTDAKQAGGIGKREAASAVPA